MLQKKTRALTWTLVGLGLAILALGTTLALTLSSALPSAQAGAFPGPWFGRGGEALARHGAWAFGHGYGALGMGMHFVGGLLFLLFIAFVVLAVARRRGFHAGAPAWHGPAEDPVTLLRIEFAEGRISEAEYRERLAVLQE